MADTVFFKIVSHTNDGEQMTQYAAWREGKAVIFVLGDPPINPYADSDPNTPPDDGASRPATVQFVLNVKTSAEGVLRAALETVTNVDFLDEVDRPPIGAVNLGNYAAYAAWFGDTLEM